MDVKLDEARQTKEGDGHPVEKVLELPARCEIAHPQELRGDAQHEVNKADPKGLSQDDPEEHRKSAWRSKTTVWSIRRAHFDPLGEVFAGLDGLDCFDTAGVTSFALPLLDAFPLAYSGAEGGAFRVSASWET